MMSPSWYRSWWIPLPHQLANCQLQFATCQLPIAESSFQKAVEGLAEGLAEGLGFRLWADRDFEGLGGRTRTGLVFRTGVRFRTGLGFGFRTGPYPSGLGLGFRSGPYPYPYPSPCGSTHGILSGGGTTRGLWGCWTSIGPHSVGKTFWAIIWAMGHWFVMSCYVTMWVWVFFFEGPLPNENEWEWVFSIQYYYLINKGLLCQHKYNYQNCALYSEKSVIIELKGQELFCWCGINICFQLYQLYAHIHACSGFVPSCYIC